jgi:predicted ferric reductase
MLVVVALWVGGGNLQDLSGWGTGVTAVGRLTGLVASDLLLIQVLLMARIPVVERVYGQDELARRHRLVGFWSFNLMWVHIVVVTLGYALQARTNLVAEAWDLVVDYPGILLAVAGALLLVVVTVTSIRKARRRLRYESWHLLHLYAYLGVGLALPHQLWAGQEFMSSTLAAAYWWTLWAAAAGAVLVWRLGLPLYRTLSHRLRVVDVVRENDEAVSVVMTGRRLDRLPVAAGQFFIWRFLDAPGWTRGHPYSLSAAPTHDTLRITVKDLGDASRGLSHVRPGTRAAIEGPYGRLHAGARSRRKVLLLAGGIGVTPLRGCSSRCHRRPATSPSSTAPPPRTTSSSAPRSRRSRTHAEPGSSTRSARASRVATRGYPRRRRTSPTSTRCASWSPTSPTTTSTSVVPTAGWTPPSAPFSPPG